MRSTTDKYYLADNMEEKIKWQPPMAASSWDARLRNVFGRDSVVRYEESAEKTMAKKGGEMLGRSASFDEIKGTKEQGNAALGRGDYHAALGHYIATMDGLEELLDTQLSEAERAEALATGTAAQNNMALATLRFAEIVDPTTSSETSCSTLRPSSNDRFTPCLIALKAASGAGYWPLVLPRTPPSETANANAIWSWVSPSGCDRFLRFSFQRSPSRRMPITRRPSSTSWSAGTASKASPHPTHVFGSCGAPDVIIEMA